LYKILPFVRFYPPGHKQLIVLNILFVIYILAEGFSHLQICNCILFLYVALIIIAIERIYFLKINWTDHVRNGEVLLSEQRNILHEIIKWKANWIGHILRRNCLLKQVIEGKIKGQK